MVTLSRIYTKTGDAGDTALGDGTRVPKGHVRVAAYGEVDELNSLVGWARVAYSGDTRLGRVQNELFDVGADLSVPYAEGDGRLRVEQGAIDRLEADCDEANEPLPELKSFVLPGGAEAGARLHVTRAVCRRAESIVLWAAGERPVNPLVPVYLNRLSDLLFILARAANAAAGDEPLWLPGGER